MEVKIKKLNEDAKIPTRGSDQAAGYDLYAQTVFATQNIKAGETAKIGTGIAAEIPDGYFGAVFARSGLATKKGLRPATAVSIIDSDYRGEIFIPLHNDSNKTQTIVNGDRIAQLVLIPYGEADFKEVEGLSGTIRGEGGFSSTGV